MQALTFKDQALRMVGKFSPIINNDGAINELLELHNIKPPKATSEEGFKNRLLCSQWWERVLVSKQAKEVEEEQIKKGNVKKGRHIYVSETSLERVVNRQNRSKRIMESKIAVADTGESLDMLEVLEASIANPSNRLAELMVRMAGFEEYAKDHGHVGEFYTITTPSKYHKFSSKGLNPKHEHTPKEAQEYLVKMWSKIRASLARKHIKVYGFRVAEPHHDGTPHWHMLLFMNGDHSQTVRDVIHDYACSESSGELHHNTTCKPTCQHKDYVPTQKGQAPCTVRFDCKRIDSEKGSATGYIAKYIAKNIGFGIGQDSEDDTQSTESLAKRVKAWSSTWGIRQFQQIGGSPVTIWRELRRLSDEDLIEDDLIKKAREAADKSNWSEFLSIMGGADAKRIHHRIKLLKKNMIDTDTGEFKQNKYEEVICKVFGICTIAFEQITRFKTWEIIQRLQYDDHVSTTDARKRTVVSGVFPPLEFCQ